MHSPLAGPWVYPEARYYYAWYEEGHLPPGRLTDGEINAMLVQRLRDNPWTVGDDIRVEVKRNVAILTGDVTSSLTKRTAGDDAWDTPGVVDVSNKLQVVTGSD